MLLLETDPLVDRRVGQPVAPKVDFRCTSASPAPAKVYVRDFLREVDIKRLSSPLAAIKKLDKLEADRDGLLDLKDAGLQISVSPNLFYAESRRTTPF